MHGKLDLLVQTLKTPIDVFVELPIKGKRSERETAWQPKYAQ